MKKFSYDGYEITIPKTITELWAANFFRLGNCNEHYFVNEGMNRGYNMFCKKKFIGNIKSFDRNGFVIIRQESGIVLTTFIKYKDVLCYQ